MASVKERSAARLAAVQALYQMDLSGAGVVEVMAEYEHFWIGSEVEGLKFEPADLNFFRNLLSGVVKEQRDIDLKIDQSLSSGWPLKRIEMVLRSILRTGVYELMFRRDVPAKAAISEYVSIAHNFYEGEETGLVNAVLDKVAKEMTRNAGLQKTEASELL